MRFLRLLFLCLVYSSALNAQEIRCISKGIGSDSSFYSIAKINENEYWLCGETGILKRLDTLGNLQNISIPEYHGHLLKVMKWNDYVFLSSDEGAMYRYDLKLNRWLVKQFRGFEERCFYDFFISSDARLVICGGAKAIAKGKKRIPHGFVLQSDTSFSHQNILRKRVHEFNFLIRPDEHGNTRLLSFNGHRSKIYVSKNLKKWKKKESIRGLVHDILQSGDTLLYCGAGGIRYKEAGLFGCRPSVSIRQEIPDIGCIWRLQEHRGSFFGISRSGGLLEIEPRTARFLRRPLTENFSIYAIAFTPGGKCILAGNGKRIYMMDMSRIRD